MHVRRANVNGQYEIPKEWIARQMGLTTKMIDDHYGEWINEDAPHMGEMCRRCWALKFL